MSSDKRIVFLGTPAMSAYVLEGLVKAGFNIVGVITREDKPQGRKMVNKPSKVAEMAESLGLKVFKPHKLNKEYQFLDELQPDLLLTFAYGQIISETVLAYSKLPPLNLHASLLPKYRGAAPIQYALRNGEKETGVCLMQMVKAMDAGQVFACEKIKIDAEDNYTSLCVKVQELALSMAVKDLPLFFEGKLVGKEQDEAQVTLCPSIKKEEEHLNLMQTPVSFVNQVRSLSLTPGGYLLMADETIFKIYKAELDSMDTLAPIGKIVKASKNKIILQVFGGTVSLTEVQKPGKRPMSAIDFNNGNHAFEGSVLK